jgi:pyruvate dehydrogenase complex dehydrogenase (E1) component
MSAIPKHKMTMEEYIEFDKNNEEYLLVAQDRPRVTQYVRQPNGQWLRRDIEEMEGVVKFTSADCELTFSEIYRLVKFPPTESVIRPV